MNCEHLVENATYLRLPPKILQTTNSATAEQAHVASYY